MPGKYNYNFLAQFEITSESEPFEYWQADAFKGPQGYSEPNSECVGKNFNFQSESTFQGILIKTSRFYNEKSFEIARIERYKLAELKVICGRTQSLSSEFFNQNVVHGEMEINRNENK